MRIIKSIRYNIYRIFSNFFYHIRCKFNIPHPVDFEYLDLIFENCNYVRIPSRLVSGVYASGIKQSIWTNFCQQYSCSYYCEEFYAHIKNEALKIETFFQKEHESDENSSFENHLKTYKDITHFTIKPTKKKKWYVATPYGEDEGRSCTNKYQSVEFGDEEFVISIKK